jgi:hypothetical protein
MMMSGVAAGKPFRRANNAAAPEGKAEVDEPPAWFWAVIEETRPNLAALEAWLVAQPKATVERFANAYWDASSELCDYSEGVLINGDVWSEDSTEDLCAWVVSQGRALWVSVASGERSLAEVAEVYLGRATDAGSIRWTTEVSDPRHRGYQSPEGIARGVYWSRFAED